MAKALRVFLWGLALTLVGVVALAPHLVPPLVTRYVSKAAADFGLSPDVRMSMRYCWRNGPGVEGAFRAVIPNSPWRLDATFGASCCEWEAHVRLPEASFDETDAVLARLVARTRLPGVSNLVFSGSVSADAHARRTHRMPVPVWNVSLPVRRMNVGLCLNGQEISVDGLSVTARVSGIAGHVDVGRLRPRLAAGCFGGFSVSNLVANVHVSGGDLAEVGKMVTVEEASADFCGGTVSVFSLYLDAARHNTGLTLFLDNVDAGKVLSHVNGFSGEASGRMHGKVKVRVYEGGQALRLSDAFLYSTPGETGVLKMRNAELVTDNLAYAGVDDQTSGNLANALSNLDYSVLRMDLRRTEGRMARLSVRIGGTATRGQTTVPVDVTINLNGDFEQLINTGLGYSSRLKGGKKK